MTDLNKEREAFEAIKEIQDSIRREQLIFNTKLGCYTKKSGKMCVSANWTNGAWFVFERNAKAQAVPDTHLLVEKSKIETWWQDAEEPENFASRIEDMPSLGQYINGDEIMEIIEHHTIHLPSKTIYGVWADKDGDRSFCTGTLDECQALVASESGAEG
ncbi:hypothetical protein EGX84_12120 [Acinetobacter baumannii]|nr:hypothetical protein [Acinetobacter baumannii]AYX87270.1 hypothetical protein EGX84_12120 [Acinetobacter baumannii]